MAQATHSKQSGKSGKASRVHRVNGGSPLADLASKATTQSATAAAHNDKPHGQITGQYWLERFVTNDEGEISKMNAVRNAVNSVDVATMKKSLDDMVEQASLLDEQAGFKDKTKNKGPLYKTASNIRTVISRCYGAMKFAGKDLEKAGFTNKTGFHAGYVISKKVLDDKAIKWTGEHNETREEREARLVREREEKAYTQLRKDFPRGPNESIAEYNERLLAKLDEKIKQDADERQAKDLEKYVNQITELGFDLAEAVAHEILKAVKAKRKEAEKAAKTEQVEIA